MYQQPVGRVDARRGRRLVAVGLSIATGVAIVAAALGGPAPGADVRRGPHDGSTAAVAASAEVFAAPPVVDDLGDEVASPSLGSNAPDLRAISDRISVLEQLPMLSPLFAGLDRRGVARPVADGRPNSLGSNAPDLRAISDRISVLEQLPMLSPLFAGLDRIGVVRPVPQNAQDFGAPNVRR